MVSKQPEARSLAAEVSMYGTPCALKCAAKLRSQDDLIAELLGALEGLDEAYCRAGSPLNRDERTKDRKRLMAARAALAKAKEQQ